MIKKQTRSSNEEEVFGERLAAILLSFTTYLIGSEKATGQQFKQELTGNIELSSSIGEISNSTVFQSRFIPS